MAQLVSPARSSAPPEQTISTGAEFAQDGKMHCSNTVTAALQSAGTSLSLDHALLPEVVTYCSRTCKARLQEGEKSSSGNRQGDGSASKFVQGKGQHKHWETKAGK